MLICNRCSTSIAEGARFCPACGDPVTAGDLVRNQAVPRSESVQLVCPHCERQALYSGPSNGVARLTCAEHRRTDDAPLNCSPDATAMPASLLRVTVNSASSMPPFPSVTVTSLMARLAGAGGQAAADACDGASFGRGPVDHPARGGGHRDFPQPGPGDGAARGVARKITLHPRGVGRRGAERIYLG